MKPLTQSFRQRIFRKHMLVRDVKNQLLNSLFSILLFWMIIHTSCLPIDVSQPSCFPHESCPRGLSCIEGRCEAFPERSIELSFSCLSSPACLNELQVRAQESLSTESGDGVFCLLIEQPQQLTAHAITLEPDEPQRVHIPLSSSALRASLVLLQAPECPESEEKLKAMGLGLTCAQELGCLLQLRHPQVSADLVHSSDLISLNFSNENGQCLDLTWSSHAPIEICNEQDEDCDGFIDEGILCNP